MGEPITGIIGEAGDPDSLSGFTFAFLSVHPIPTVCRDSCRDSPPDNLVPCRRTAAYPAQQAHLQQLLEDTLRLVDAQTQERVRTADAEQLLEWGTRALKANRLSDIFGD
jgi:hypothetical protein